MHMLAPAMAEIVPGQECLQAGLSTDIPAQTVTTTQADADIQAVTGTGVRDLHKLHCQPSC